MSRTPFLLAIILLATALSGCVLPTDGEAPVERIVKKVRVVLTPQTLENAESFEDVVHTAFEYTHQGAAVPAAELRVEFLDEDGQAVEHTLDRYAGEGQIQDGDIVTIDGANLTSGLKVKNGESVLVERDGLRVAWFTAEGAPIPIATTEPGRLRYVLDGSADFSLSGKDFVVGEGEDEILVENVVATLKALGEGTLDVQTTAAPQGPRVDLDVQLLGSQSADADVTYTQEGRRINAGIDADFRGTFNATGRLIFDDRHRLVRAGSSSDAWADGDLIAWDEDHPKSEQWRPEDLSHPLVQERSEYSEEDVDVSSEDLSELVIQFLDRLWNTRIGVGDEYYLEASDGGEGGLGGFLFKFVVQVVALDEREVGGETMDTFRVSETMTLVTNTPRAGESNFDLARTTLWISADHYVPVFQQTDYKKSFDRDDVRRLLEALPEDAGFSVPDEAQMVLGGELTVKLEEYSGDLTTAPLFGLTAWSGLGQYGVVGAMAFVLASDIGGETSMAAPAVSFNMDESVDRIEVTAASSMADWGRMSLESDAPGVHFGLNRQASLFTTEVPPDGMVPIGGTHMQAGDYLDFCSESATPKGAAITLIDHESNTIIFMGTFEDLAFCTA